MKRRTFLCHTTIAGIGSRLPFCGPMAWAATAERRFHVCLSVEALKDDPGFLPLLKDAGIHAIWLAGYFYGYWPYALADLQATRAQIMAAGLEVNLVNVPLGHPGDSLGSTDGAFPLTPPSHWKMARRVDGTAYAGTSLHEPATEDNAAAIRELQKSGFRAIFLDDDFRLAPSPGQIGGCFCDAHRDAFLQRGGYSRPRWDELVQDVRDRRLTPLLRDWIAVQCDQLSLSFQAQQAVLQDGALGIMVMYLGSEKAGIRLADYTDVPFRVGELMFDDASFGRVKGKTDELFSALFHRRFARPELAYSETTAYPAQSLSARHLAAKLAISTLADVRNTMFMSGVTPFPKPHWETIAPAMKIQAALHRKLAGHIPRGPFKHDWGEASRLIGDDQPFSLFLAAGVPFEVVDQPATAGWTFLSDYDARALADSKTMGKGTTYIHRPSVNGPIPNGEAVEETLEALFAFKHRIKDQLHHVPHVQDDVPVVCAWYPTARAVLLWNLNEEEQHMTLRHGDMTVETTVPGLGTRLIEDLPELPVSQK